MAYRPEGSREVLSLEQRCIMMAVFCNDDGLGIRARPDWEGVVRKPDHDYVADLFKDFRERAKTDPDALFEQLCSLSVGPLITDRVAEHQGDRDDVMKLWDKLVDLERA